MLLSAFCFAAMAALSNEVAASFDWLGVVFARAFSNFVFVAALAVVTSKPIIVFSAPRNLWVRSISGTICMLCCFFAYTHLPVAESISLTNTTPVWMALLVSYVTSRSVSRSVWAGAACGLIGVLLIQRPQFNEADIAILAGLGGALFGAIAFYNLHLVKDIHPTTIVAHFSLIASIACFLVMVPSLYVAPEKAAWTGKVLTGLVGIGAVGTLGQLAMTRAFMAGSPTINATVGLVQVAFGLGFDILIWDRSFDVGSIAGIVLITSPTVFYLVEQRSASSRTKIPGTIAKP